MTHDLTLVKTEAGRAYLAEVMNNERGLCNAMRNQICEAGVVYAIAPEGTPAHRFEQVEQFEYGGFASPASRQGLLINRIAYCSKVGRPGVLLVQDPWATPSDYSPDIPRPNYLVNTVSYFINNDSVYLWTHTDDIEYVGACLMRPLSWNYVAYLVPDPVAAEQFREGLISADALVPAITEIYSPAYDHESFVIWSRAG